MATLKLNTKTLATQTSSAEPVIATGVTGSPTIALTNATGTIPNGTQDNITRLGTVASGTLGSTVVFPSSHIIKVTDRRHNTAASVAVSGSTAADSDANDLDITATAGNKIVCWIVGGYVTMTATMWSGTGIRVYDGGDSANHDYITQQGYSTTERSGNTSVMCVHTVQGSGSVALKIKKMVWDKEGAGTITWYNAESKYTAYTVMEVQA